MPKQWNDIWVVEEHELVPRFYNTASTLRSAVSRYKDLPYGIKKVRRGGNGSQALYDYDSLSNEIKTAIGDPRKPVHLMDLFYEISREAVSFYNDFQFDDEGYLSDKHKEEYITNASVLIACINLKATRESERRSKGQSVVGVMSTICTDAINFNPALKTKYGTSHTLPSSEKRFKTAFNKFQKTFKYKGKSYQYDYSSLISGKLRNQNSRKVDDPTITLLNDMFAGQTHKPNRTEVARMYDGFLQGYVQVIKTDGSGEIYSPEGYKPLHETTIVKYLGSWNESIGTYAKRSGDRQKLMQKFKPYHSLERPKYAGSIISIDDRQPPFEYMKGERPWFYNAIDLGSECFTCYVHGRNKEGIIVEFYRQLVRNYAEWGFNLPLEVEAESNLNSSFTKTFLQPGAMFQYVRIEPNNARGKRIERYFRNLRYGDEKQREGWLARPFAINEANQKGAGEKVTVPYNEIIENCLRDIKRWNDSPHTVIKHKTRWEVFCEMQNPDIQPTNWKAILPHLGYATSTSVNAGIIRLQGGEYVLGDNGEVYTGERLIKLMRRVEGMDVTVYWLDGNDGEVMKAIVYVGDTCICEAIPKPVYQRATAERTPKCAAAYKLMSSYVATIDGYMNMRSKEITEVVVIDKTPRTLNNAFPMAGLSENNVSQQIADDTPEILDPIEEEDYDVDATNNKSFVRSTKDRI